jgi:hypothetical protein
MWLYIVALAMHLHEVLWDAFKAEVEDIAARAIPGSKQWYADRAREYQHGASLLFDPATYRYFYADTTSDAAIAQKIVTRVSVQEVFTSGFSGVRMKVAKSDPPEALDSTEETAFTFYMQRLRFAGVAMEVITRAADEVRVELAIYYDGTVPLNDIQTRVEDALNAFLAAIPFDGMLYKNKLIDALQSTSGIKDVEVLGLYARPDGGSFWVNVARAYQPVSGYYLLTAPGETSGTDSIITYTAE